MSVFAWILLSLLALILIVLFSPLSALISYHSDGFSVTLKYLFFHITFPKKERTIKQVKEEKNSTEKPRKKGKLSDLISLIKLVLKTLGKLVRAIRIRDLRINALIASEDPFRTAMMFGGSGATVGILLPLLENNFRIDRRTVNVNADFEQTESTVELFAKCSVRVIQVLAIALVFAYNFLKNQNKRKDVSNVRTKSK